MPKEAAHSSIDIQLAAAAASINRGNWELGFSFLERAHVLAQTSTYQHVRVHWLMLRWAIHQQNIPEFLGQIVRIVGAASKTALGLVPTGNTGGANVNPFRPMPIPADLVALLIPPKSTKKAWLTLGIIVGIVLTAAAGHAFGS